MALPCFCATLFYQLQSLGLGEAREGERGMAAVIEVDEVEAGLLLVGVGECEPEFVAGHLKTDTVVAQDLLDLLNDVFDFAVGSGDFHNTVRLVSSLVPCNTFLRCSVF
jgi:hypothetical protein